MESEIPAKNNNVWTPTLSMTSSETRDSEAMEMESQTEIQNLLTAYSEATGLEQRELAKVIQKCITEKASHNGPTLERLALNLFPCARTEKDVKLEDDDSGFEETRWHLLNHARSVGVDLKVEERELGQIVNGNAFMVFNCMVGLPHMGRSRGRGQVMEFMKIAKGLLAKSEGIITFGDGEDSNKVENYASYPLFFDGKLSHYKALYESMEWGFPSYLNEGRMAMETLFVVPFVSSVSWLQKWEEGREYMFSQNALGLKGRKMSRESWNEARELVKEGESPYKIRVEGGNENEMVLEWNGTSLVRVSVWM
ncbi:hypothetical protein L2E82_21179 [Cichorium intybus]|uniref:Uncharacterized protein n=1 Tax=Cichorium intybus TaxID=13427 RepID=A0ACB9DVP7_CICIN|nr:hypothetical protein L2E82_21179 [Cichorium intybus]